MNPASTTRSAVRALTESFLVSLATILVAPVVFWMLLNVVKIRIFAKLRLS